MWVFLPGGFISVVAHREQPNDFMIRSRNSEHLSILFPECEIIELDDSDYRYRTVLPRREVNDMISKHIENMEYDNFKSSISESEYNNACNHVWRVMYSYGQNR